MEKKLSQTLIVIALFIIFVGVMAGLSALQNTDKVLCIFWGLIAGYIVGYCMRDWRG